MPLPTQKHFIKLLLRGEEVPSKVAETGRGYTLSGKARPAVLHNAGSSGHAQRFALLQLFATLLACCIAGKALDPNSAAARAYGLKPDLFARES